MPGRDLERADRWFDRYGAQAEFFGLLVPGLRSLIPVPVGLNGMPALRFLLLSLFGTVVWTLLLALLGFVVRQYASAGRYLGSLPLVLSRAR